MIDPACVNLNRTTSRQHINYKKLANAHRYLEENKGCHFVLTNDDSTFPSANGHLYPGMSVGNPLGGPPF
jgi:ribonucleotide monophosphatase NagD (HAD superfamily)